MYTLIGSYSTVQVLSPTQINDVVYSTIQTSPSGVIASKALQQRSFDQGEAGAELDSFATSIEDVMADPRVIAATGSQSIDDSGLLADNVLFTVQYIDPVHAPNGATAQATVGVNQLNFSDQQTGSTLQAGVTATIDGVYANLKAAAGG
jgi:hypothetical protein